MGLNLPNAVLNVLNSGRRTGLEFRAAQRGAIVPTIGQRGAWPTSLLNQKEASMGIK